MVGSLQFRILGRARSGGVLFDTWGHYNEDEMQPCGETKRVYFETEARLVSPDTQGTMYQGVTCMNVP